MNSDGDDAAHWAHRSLPAKNALTVVDAQLVEAVRDKLAAFSDEQPGPHPESAQSHAAGATLAHPNSEAEKLGLTPSRQSRIRHGRVPTKTIRLRDKDHRKFVSSQPCVACGRSPTDAHHLRFAQPQALSRKVSDEFTVPVCRVHRRELHRHGNEVAWWQRINIDPLPIAHRLWQHARRDGSAVAINGDTGTEPKFANTADRAGSDSVPTSPDFSQDPGVDGTSS